MAEREREGSPYFREVMAGGLTLEQVTQEVSQIVTQEAERFRTSCFEVLN